MQTTDLSLSLAAETLAARQELEQSGYRLPGKPVVDLPRLPARISELSDDALMELFTQLTRWADHIAGVTILHEIDERYAESYYELVWTEILSRNAPKSRGDGSVTMARAESMQNPLVREAITKKDMVYAKRKILQQMRDNLERDTNLVSRELSRRIGRAPSENRTNTFRP